MRDRRPSLVGPKVRFVEHGWELYPASPTKNIMHTPTHEKVCTSFWSRLFKTFQPKTFVKVFANLATSTSSICQSKKLKLIKISSITYEHITIMALT